MPRENAEARGRRLLVEGRLVVRRVDEHEIQATNPRRLGGAPYHRLPPRRLVLPVYPARTRCAHLVALLLVVLRPGGAPRA